MYPQIFSHIFPQIINFFIYKYYPQIFSPKYSHVSIHNYSRIFILRNCLPSHRYSCLPTHMFLPLPFLRFVFLVRTQIALAIIVHGHFSIMYNCLYSIFSGSNLGLEPPRSAENTCSTNNNTMVDRFLFVFNTVRSTVRTISVEVYGGRKVP